MISPYHLVLRIAVGAVLGGIIGYERDRHGRHVGLRTHLIVSMAAATFMVISAHFIDYQQYLPGQHYEADLSRIAASVVSGIGFLAGGAILRTGATVQGLTTAAGLWLVTAIGLCAGAGMYVVGCSVTFMGLVALTVLRLFENKNDHVIRREVAIELKDETTSIPMLMEELKKLGAKISDIDYERQVDAHRLMLKFEVKLPDRYSVPTFVEHLEAHTNVIHLRVGTPK